MAITLQEAKEYLRVGYDDDNDYIAELIDISEAYIDGCVGTAYREKDISTHILTKRMTAILNKNNLFKIAYYINNKHFISIVDIFFHFHIYF